MSVSGRLRLPLFASAAFLAGGVIAAGPGTLCGVKESADGCWEIRCWRTNGDVKVIRTYPKAFLTAPAEVCLKLAPGGKLLMIVRRMNDNKTHAVVLATSDGRLVASLEADVDAGWVGRGEAAWALRNSGDAFVAEHFELRPAVKRLSANVLRPPAEADRLLLYAHPYAIWETTRHILITRGSRVMTRGKSTPQLVEPPEFSMNAARTSLAHHTFGVYPEGGTGFTGTDHFLIVHEGASFKARLYQSWTEGPLGPWTFRLLGWTRDGKKLVASRLTEKGTELVRLDGGKKFTTLLRLPQGIKALTWAP